MKLAVLCFALLSLAACAAPPAQPTGVPMDTAPVAGFVADLPAFEQFIATQPTVEAFQARYPDVLLVLPGSMTTKEFRSNNSRYFAQLDEQGRIIGGRFQ